jgi:hypothetical protein
MLNTVDSAIFVMSLDSEIARTSSDIAQLILCGDLANRWADKSMGSVTFHNGVDGALSEVYCLSKCVLLMMCAFFFIRLWVENMKGPVLISFSCF